MELSPHEEKSTSTGDTATSGTQSLSKNAQKKLAKAARFAEQKKERRAYEKQKKKEKKRLLAEKRAAGELDSDDERQRKKARTGEAKVPRKPFNARIVVDLGFDDLMSENEIKSLTSQLAFTYSANRRAIQRFSSLLFTSLNGRTFTRLESLSDAAYKRWVDTEWWDAGYERLWDNSVLVDGEISAAGPSSSSRQIATRESVVYLTADSNTELSELREGETYVIGGLCDHNRYKNLCLQKSQETGIRSARLPIGTYLAEMRTRKVLTVNQTFEILLKWVETRDWEQALYAVVPKRKFQDKGKEDVSDSFRKSEEVDDDEEELAEAVVIDEQTLQDETEAAGQSDTEVRESVGVAKAVAQNEFVSGKSEPSTSMNPVPS